MPTPITIAWKFLKAQDWKWGIPCIVLLWFFYYSFYLNMSFDNITYEEWLAWRYGTAALFLMVYTFKYSRKSDRSFWDKFKLGFYYVYFLLLLVFISHDPLGHILYYFFSWFILYLYFYSFVFFIQQEAERNHKPLHSSWYIAIAAQTLLMLGLVLWSLTLKVETEKQKILALEAKSRAEIEKREVILEKRQFQESEKITQQELKKYKQLYEEALRQRK